MAPAKKQKSSSSDKNLTPEINFEAALAELEALVEQMEAGDLSLDDSLQAFERGIKLTRQCQAALGAAELRVKVLAEEGGLDADELSALNLDESE